MNRHIGRRTATATVAVALTVALGPATAAQAAPPTSPPVPQQLPGEASAAGVRADHATWIVGARPNSASRRIARRFGARKIAGSAWEVRRARARQFARALQTAGLLTYSEPNRLAQPTQAVAPDPLSHAAAWRDVVVESNLTPPPVTGDSPLLALIDSQLDPGHPEFAGGNVATAGTRPVTDGHGTATAAVAAAPKNDVGILGVWPGMRAVNFSVPPLIRCSDSSRSIRAAVRAGARVINMSYGSPDLCFAEYEQLQRATRAGVTLVAAAGNEFAEGNPLEYPASYPHVLTVGAVGPNLRPSYFSNANLAIDLSAPGEGILTAVPARFDTDGNRDGFQALDGTSFAAPMVAAAAAWVRAVRPDLTSDQLSQVIRLGARDIGSRGWDQETGFGLLSVNGALNRQAPPPDTGEPNDRVIWVDGRAFGRPAPYVWRGRGTARRFGTVDKFEDPVDILRVRLPARSRTRILLRPRAGDPDLAVLPGTIKELSERRPIAQSQRTGRRTDAVTVRNRSRRARLFYVAAYVHPGGDVLDASYVLTIRKTR